MKGLSKLAAATITDRSSSRHKVTLRLSPDAYLTTQEGVELGLSPNQNSFIEEAIRLRAREVRNAKMRLLAAEAMSDEDFIADMHDTMRAFEFVDRENWITGPNSEKQIP